MGKKIIIAIYIALCFPVSIYSQAIKGKSYSRYIRDEYGIVVKSIIDSTLVYVTKTGKKLIIHYPLNTIHYEGGIKKLKEDICHNVADINNENNIRGLFYILFDANLHIIETRAVDVAPIVDNWPVIVSNYLLYLNKTEGKWIKDKEGLNYYLYAFLTIVN